MTFDEKLNWAMHGEIHGFCGVPYFHDMLGEFSESQIIGISVDEFSDAYNGSALLVIDAGSDYVVKRWYYGTCEVCCEIMHMDYYENLTMYDIVNKHTTHCANLDEVREHIGFNDFEDVVWREV